MLSKVDEVDFSEKMISKCKKKTITKSEWMRALKYKWFRLCTIYYIKTKDGEKVLFSPNQAQREYYINSHQNDVILKARQLGFTTFVMIYSLDSCLFKKNFSAGCIAHSEKDSKDIYRNKIRFAYQNIKPSTIRLLELIGYKFPVPTNDKDNGYVFSNGSSIGVSTGYRGGTLQSLHVSEFAKICKKYPEKAREIVTGAFNSVGKNCTKTIESTAEGKQGYFYDYCSDAEKLKLQGREPASLEFKFHFFPWWKDAQYFVDEEIEISKRLKDYFKKLKDKDGVELTQGQMNWYALIEKTQGDDMKREYPSTPKEAFEQAIEGAYYAEQFAAIYRDGRINDCASWDNKGDINTAWDIGIGDSTAIWFYRKVGNEIHIVHYYENSGESLGHYIKYVHDTLSAKDWTMGKNYGPHDMNNREFASKGKTRKELAKEGVDYNGATYRMDFEIVPKLSIMDGIEISRQILKLCVFDEQGTESGVKALENYRKEWNEKLGCYRDHPLHDWSSHGADAFRYLAVQENGSRKPFSQELMMM